MMTEQRSRIVEAMYELRERRDAGEPVHMILNEVAEDHRVPVDVLRQLAEDSWGIPLENDRERHAAHFKFVEDAADLRKQSSQLAKAIYEENLPYIKEWKPWTINWEREIDEVMKNAGLNNPALEQIARDQFMIEASHFENIIKFVRGQDA